MKKFEKFITRGGEKLLFGNKGSKCLFMLYLIIVFNNKVLEYFSKTWASQQIHGHFISFISREKLPTVNISPHGDNTPPLRLKILGTPS